jgi:signal transduction histidine kinase
VLPGRHAKSAPSEPAPQPRPAEPLALLATCIADSLGVAHCIIEYSSASGELFQACTPSTQAIYEALRSIDPAATDAERVLVVEDAGRDWTLPNAARALAPNAIGFLASHPLHLQSGTLIGRIWLADRKPRLLSPNELQRFTSFAAMASEMIYQLGRNARLLEAQAMARTGTWEWRAGTAVLFGSRTFAELFGLEADRRGLAVTALFRRVHPDDRRRLRDAIADTLASRSGGAIELLIRTADSRTVHAIASMRVDIDHGGRLVGAFGTLQDVSDRRRAEELDLRNQGLEQALALANQLAEEQRNFVAIVSHEFRTPLAIIDASAHRMGRLLGNSIDTERLRTTITTIRSSVVRLVGVLESMLCISRLESGRIEANFQPVDLAAMLAGIRSNQLAITPNRAVELDSAALTQPVAGDEKLLQHVVANLISKAVKYSPDGGLVRIVAWLEDENAVIAVSDQGVGIPADELPKLFQRFFRAHTSAGIIGTGYGLNIVKQFVELHGGGIEVESVEGKGSTFTVRLPLKPGRPAGEPG